MKGETRAAVIEQTLKECSGWLVVGGRLLFGCIYLIIIFIQFEEDASKENQRMLGVKSIKIDWLYYERKKRKRYRRY